jgi:hypothetical protein
VSKNLTVSYERKLFALAITNMLFNCTNIPPSVKDSAGYFLAEVIAVLVKQQRIEQK